MKDDVSGRITGRTDSLRSEIAYDKLLELLLSGQVQAGSALQERKLANQLGISRTPIREALARLEAEGLVTSQGNRSLTVRKIDIQDFVEILKVRKLLEVEAVGLAAEKGVNAEVARKTRNAIEGLLANSSPTTSEHWAVDDQIHGMISDAAGNKLLAAMILDLRRRTHIFDTNKIPERRVPGAEEHLAMLEAIEAGSSEVARKLMAEHIENAKLAIINRILSIS